MVGGTGIEPVTSGL